MWIMCVLPNDMDHPESQDSNSELLLVKHIHNCAPFVWFFCFFCFLFLVYTVNNQQDHLLVLSWFLKRQISTVHDLCTVQVKI